MLRFDKHGYLEPYEVVDATLAEVEQCLVNEFSQSNTRKRLFENYRWYVQELMTLVQLPFQQWAGWQFCHVKNKSERSGCRHIS